MKTNKSPMERERKEKAVQFLKKLGIFEPYVKGFEENDRVCFFKKFVGYWADQEPEIEAKMREIEKAHNCTVYAVTHEFTYFGELYDFLIVTDYSEEWSELMRSNGDFHRVFAYVWNKSDDKCSEFGFVTLMSAAGGILRIGIDP